MGATETREGLYKVDFIEEVLIQLRRTATCFLHENAVHAVDHQYGSEGASTNSAQRPTRQNTLFSIKVLAQTWDRTMNEDAQGCKPASAASSTGPELANSNRPEVNSHVRSCGPPACVEPGWRATFDAANVSRCSTAFWQSSIGCLAFVERPGVFRASSGMDHGHQCGNHRLRILVLVHVAPVDHAHRPLVQQST